MTHAVVGVWIAEASYESQFRIDRLTTAFHADGTVTISTSDGNHDGAWLATGDNSARLLVVRPVPHGEGIAGWFTMRGTVEVSADGATFTMQAVIKRPRPDGGGAETSSRLAGTRLTPDTAL